MNRQNGVWRDKLINYKKSTIIFCITQLLSILTIDFQIVTNKYCHKDNWSCTISSLSRMKEPKIQYTYIRYNCPHSREFHEFVIGTRILRFPCGWIATKQSTTRNRLEFYVKLSSSQFDASRSRTILGLKRWMGRRVNNVTSKVSWIF